MSQDDDVPDAQVRDAYRRLRAQESPGPGVDARIRAAAVSAASAWRADSGESRPDSGVRGQSSSASVPTAGAAVANARPRTRRRFAYFAWGGALAAGLALFAVVLPMGKPPTLIDEGALDPAAVTPAPPRRSAESDVQRRTAANAEPVRNGALNAPLAPAAAVLPDAPAATRDQALATTDAVALPAVLLPPAAARAKREGVVGARKALEVSARDEPGVAATVESADRGRPNAGHDESTAARQRLSTMAPSPSPSAPDVTAAKAHRGRASAERVSAPAVSAVGVSPAEIRTSETSAANSTATDAGAAGNISSGSRDVHSPAAETTKERAADDVDASLVDLRRMLRARDAALMTRLRAFVTRFPDYPLRRTDPELAALLQP